MYQLYWLPRSAARAGKGITSVTSNTDMVNIIKIRKPLENLSILIHRVSKIVKQK